MQKQENSWNKFSTNLPNHGRASVGISWGPNFGKWTSIQWQSTELSRWQLVRATMSLEPAMERWMKITWSCSKSRSRSNPLKRSDFDRVFRWSNAVLLLMSFCLLEFSDIFMSDTSITHVCVLCIFPRDLG